LSIPNGAQRASGRIRLRHRSWAIPFVLLVFDLFVAIPPVIGDSVTLALTNHDDNSPADPTYTLYDTVSLVGGPATTPTSAPTPTPTPTPKPTPTPTPTPAPAGIAVPASIDSTGATDASAALYAWVRTVPDGSTIVFKAGGYYRMDTGLIVNGRHNLTFEGNGATLKSNGGYTEASSLFRVFGDTGIVIRDFNLVGNSPTPGVYRPGQEGAHGIQIVEGSNIEIANVNISNTYGDCANTDYWTDGVWFHDSSCKSSGRNGVAIFAGKNMTVERVVFDKNGGGVFDIEPYQSSGGATNIKFINNTSGTHTNGFFDANGGSVISNITVSGNTLTGGSLGGYVWLASPRVQNLVFTNNTATVPRAGPAMYFSHIDGLTVTGNVQPLTSGVFAQIADCTGVTYQP
jgi:hypothetical protein